MAERDWLYYAGFLLAFLSAASVILIDCSQTLRKELKRLPVNLFKSGPVLVLASACGLIAAICYGFSYSDWMKQIVDLKWQNPIFRAILVGVAVLTILRSKFFNFKEQGIGGELFYNLGRSWAVESVWNKWVAIKNCIASDERVTAAIALGNFEDQLDASIAERLQFAPEEDKKAVKKQFDNVRKTKPSGSPDLANPKWRLYYKIQIKLALDSAGLEVLASIPGFESGSLRACLK